VARAILGWFSVVDGLPVVERSPLVAAREPVRRSLYPASSASGAVRDLAASAASGRSVRFGRDDSDYCWPRLWRELRVARGIRRRRGQRHGGHRVHGRRRHCFRALHCSALGEAHTEGSRCPASLSSVVRVTLPVRDPEGHASRQFCPVGKHGRIGSCHGSERFDKSRPPCVRCWSTKVWSVELMSPFKCNRERIRNAIRQDRGAVLFGMCVGAALLSLDVTDLGFKGIFFGLPPSVLVGTLAGGVFHRRSTRKSQTDGP
jgi:hypothetical protein